MPPTLESKEKGFSSSKLRPGRLTRATEISRSPAAGQLLTQAGDPVLGEQGPINVPSGPLSISADGTLSVNGAVVDTLRLVEFAPGSSPAAVGTSYYSAPDNSVQPAAHSSVRQGMLEASNVSPVTAVVDLLAIQRRAEMLERAMSAFYSNFNKVAANDLPHV